VVRESAVLPALRQHVLMEAARMAGKKLKRIRITTPWTKPHVPKVAAALESHGSSAAAPVQRKGTGVWAEGVKVYKAKAQHFLGWTTGEVPPGIMSGDPVMGRDSEVAPPGREKQVRALKKKPGVKNPFAVAWASKNKAMFAANNIPGTIDARRSPAETRRPVARHASQRATTPIHSRHVANVIPETSELLTMIVDAAQRVTPTDTATTPPTCRPAGAASFSSRIAGTLPHVRDRSVWESLTEWRGDPSLFGPTA